MPNSKKLLANLNGQPPQKLDHIFTRVYHNSFFFETRILEGDGSQLILRLI